MSGQAHETEYSPGHISDAKRAEHQDGLERMARRRRCLAYYDTLPEPVRAEIRARANVLATERLRDPRFQSCGDKLLAMIEHEVSDQIAAIVAKEHRVPDSEPVSIYTRAMVKNEFGKVVDPVTREDRFALYEEIHRDRELRYDPRTAVRELSEEEAVAIERARAMEIPPWIPPRPWNPQDWSMGPR